MDVRIGCCGFPRSRSEYYRTFKIVEIQQTFYHPPRPETAEKWRAEAPADFEFTLKAWQLITHEPQSPTYRRLKLSWPAGRLARCGSFKPTEEVLWAWEETRKIAAALQSRFVVFQCPASFHPSPENKKNLRSFFKRAGREDFQLIWEPRGKWEPQEIHEICRELNLIHGVDPFKNKPTFGEIRYFRLHGITGYRYRFSEEDLRALRGRCRGMTYCLFNNVQMWSDARTFSLLAKQTFRQES
jgi:uncharacterized protein YecE (DUF72 family)